MIKKESISCKPWSWVQMEHHMGMVLICSIFTSMTLIQTIHQKLTSLPPEMVKSDLIPIFTVVEKYVSVFWVLGEEAQWKIGIQKFPLFCKFLSQFSPLSCLNKFTSMSPDSNMNKELLKEKRRIKLMLTSSDMVTLNLQWFKTLKIHQKDSNILLRDISTLKKMKFLKKLRNGSNMLKKERLHTTDSSATTIITGVIPLKNQKLSTKLCLRKPSKSLKNNWTNFQNHLIKISNQA